MWFPKGLQWTHTSSTRCTLHVANTSVINSVQAHVTFSLTGVWLLTRFSSYPWLPMNGRARRYFISCILCVGYQTPELLLPRVCAWHPHDVSASFEGQLMGTMWIVSLGSVHTSNPILLYIYIRTSGAVLVSTGIHLPVVRYLWCLLPLNISTLQYSYSL